MPAIEQTKISRSFVHVLAALTLIFFLATTFRIGWTRAASDFPNYYTGAWLIRKHEPLRKYYDWTWFERQIVFAGYEQVGAYYPFTPLSTLPMVPIAGLKPQIAKRVWLAFSLGCLAISLRILSRITRFNLSELWLLTFAGFGALHQNFVFGQYYVFLLLLFTVAFSCFIKGSSAGAGATIGSAFALKLYGAPFILFLAAKRNKKAVSGAALTLLVFAGVAVGLFGWRDNAHYLSYILPRSLAGDILDPYHSLNNTISTLLRRSLISEPTLNPAPLWRVPWLCFFLQSLIPLCLLSLTLVGVYRSNKIRQDFAWFSVAVMLISSNAGPYTYILLVLPFALLLEIYEQIWERAVLVFAWIALGSILNVTVSRFFPKVWVLLALYLITGFHYWRLICKKEYLVIFLAAGALSTGFAVLRHRSYEQEPAQQWQRLTTKGSLFEDSPALVRSGIVYQAMSANRYRLGFLRQGQTKEFSFDGQALRAIALSADGPVRFELLSKRSSVNMLFDPVTGASWQDPKPTAATKQSDVLSPDGKWIATCHEQHGIERVWLRAFAGGPEIRLTGGNCASWSPVWDLDSRSIVFVSDCGRGAGWGAMYRAHLEREMTLLQASLTGNR